MEEAVHRLAQFVHIVRFVNQGQGPGVQGLGLDLGGDIAGGQRIRPDLPVALASGAGTLKKKKKQITNTTT